MYSRLKQIYIVHYLPGKNDHSGGGKQIKMPILTITAIGVYDEVCFFWNRIKVHDFQLYFRNASDKWIKFLEIQTVNKKSVIRPFCTYIPQCILIETKGGAHA